MRNLALSALGVLVLLPEAVAHPSFQMSFAATLGLIAAYERGIPWMRAGADTPMGARIALWGGREIVALVVVSLAAGSATIPYVGFHFHRIGPYGALANLLAMPIVSAWVMPAGLLALPPRHARRQPAHGRAGLHRDRGRPHGLAAWRHDRALSDRQGVGRGRGAAGGP